MIERPVIRYFGGKYLLAPWIIDQFPAHKIYVEPYGGAASVLMRKPRSYAEVYNDLDGGVVSLFRILQNSEQSKELERRLVLTPFSREEFNLAYERSEDPIENARRLIARCYMGFGADGHNDERGKTGFRANSKKSGSTPAHDWNNYPRQISVFCERLAGVVIENRDALEVMNQQDSLETLHFVDPPYVHSTRSRQNNYKFEMTNDDHTKLLTFLESLTGMVVLCGYQNEIYNSLKWLSIKRESLADGASKRTEILWLNPAAANAKSQMELCI